MLLVFYHCYCHKLLVTTNTIMRVNVTLWSLLLLLLIFVNIVNLIFVFAIIVTVIIIILIIACPLC